MKVEMNGNNNINIGDPPSIKKPVYGVSGYTTNLAVKMTALVNPNHKVIGQQVYDALDDGQKSMYQHLNINSDVWNHVSSITGGNIYKVYTDIQKIHFLTDLERNRPILE